MNKLAQLTLGAYVVLIVVFIFIIVNLMWMVPLLSSVINSDSAYATGNLSYMVWLVPAVILGAGLVMFFMPNTVVR